MATAGPPFCSSLGQTGPPRRCPHMSAENQTKGDALVQLGSGAEGTYVSLRVWLSVHAAG